MLAVNTNNNTLMAYTIRVSMFFLFSLSLAMALLFSSRWLMSGLDLQIPLNKEVMSAIGLSVFLHFGMLSKTRPDLKPFLITSAALSVFVWGIGGVALLCQGG